MKRKKKPEGIALCDVSRVKKKIRAVGIIKDSQYFVLK